MSLTQIFSLNCFLTQYLLIFVSLLFLSKLIYCFGCISSLIGQLLVVVTISWKITKKFRKSRNQELVTSYKRAVLVTGCDTGFGNELAHKLNSNGFRVYAAVLDPECDGAKDLVTGARFEGKTKVIQMDVTNDEQIKTVFNQIKNDLQQNGEELWAVVNNAGILGVGPIDWGTMETYKDVFDVNTFGVVRVTRTFLPLIRQSKGRVINVASMCGRVTGSNLGVYSMSKYAVISFSDALRRENSKYGIKVSTIEPIAYRTPITSIESFERVVEKQWNDTSDDVKEFYGNEYYDDFKSVKAKGGQMFPASDNTYEVIDKMVDAVRSADPEIRYPVTTDKLHYRFFFNFVLFFTPTQLYDLIDSHGQLF